MYGTIASVGGSSFMQNEKYIEEAAEPLLEVDRKVRKVFLPYRTAPPVRVLSWFSEVGDQPQMRILAGGTLLIGLLRADQRMMKVGARMLLSHELATRAKTFIKDRIIRLRPRSAANGKEQKLHAAHDTSKEKSSFPSGHSAGALAVGGAFSSVYPQYRKPVLAVAATVALAQIPRCAHYPTDVAAGAVIGAAANSVVGMIWQWTTRVLGARGS